jgi:hypothetical protein
VRVGLAFLWLIACGEDELPGTDASVEPAMDADPPVRLDGGSIDDAAEADAETSDTAATDSETPPPDDGPTGFIGSPCVTESECDYEGAVCLTESDDYPRGMCSLACDRLCPDRDGHPTTFCADPSVETIDGAGACLSRCDFGFFPESGCREGYGCIQVPRANEPGTERLVCVPGIPGSVGDCYRELADLGVEFEPTVIEDQSPDGYPDLVCHVEDPVVIHPPIRGVDLVYYDGTPTPNVRAACNMALALAKTADDVSAVGVTTILHIGTYNCRPIAGTNRISRHGHGDAIDIYGFVFGDGRRYTLIDHWEHDTMMPSTPEGAFLYETAYRWHDAMVWNIILTPNYNTAHDNHFHVDLTPGSDFLQVTGGFGFIGPAPYAD